MFDKSTNKYYKCIEYQSNPPVLGYYGDWVEINNPMETESYFAAKSHTHSPSDVTGLGTWETVSTSISGVTLYVNQALRLVSFHFYASITFASSGYTTCGTLPSAYKPLSQVTI